MNISFVPTEVRKQVERRVDRFAKTHRHFDEVADDMVEYIEAGWSLKDAYRYACKDNQLR